MIAHETESSPRSTDYVYVAVLSTELQACHRPISRYEQLTIESGPELDSCLLCRRSAGCVA